MLNEMIRDRLVVGLRNATLSRKLQLEADLTLDSAITTARQTEAVKNQQAELRNDSSPSVEAVRKTSTREAKGSKTQPQWSPCTRCGRAPPHDFQQCPAQNKICHKCKKRGHFQTCCRTPKQVTDIEQELFLGAIHRKRGDQWKVTLQLDGQPIEFRIDTGADVTIIPKEMYVGSAHKPLQRAQSQLSGPDLSTLQVKGLFTGKLKLGDKEIDEEIYVARKLTRPLLGAPAIEALGLAKRVCPVVKEEGQYREEFPSLFSGLGKLNEEYKIQLNKDAQPFALSTPHRVAIPLMPKVQEELKRMEKLGVIEKVEDPTEWCAGMVMVPKADGRVRICVDLTKLNESICRERHLLPAVDQTLAQLAGAKVFTKLDANSGFWQIPLAKESSRLTTFITPFGRYCFKRLPFGFTSVPEHFQRRISSILAGLDGVVCQMDDILVHGKDQAQHDTRLKAVLQRLQEAGLTLNSEKCQFSRSCVKFLGHLVDQDGIHPDPDKVAAIVQVQPLSDVSAVRQFLGMANQMSKFCPNLADKTKPSRELLNESNEWTWGEAHQKAFEDVKTSLSSEPILTLYDPNNETVAADASAYGLGAVILQKQSTQEWKPVAYISRAMTSTEQRYPQIEKEVLALTWACERFADYLLGLEFNIQTDHKPLVPLFSTKCLEELPL